MLYGLEDCTILSPEGFTSFQEVFTAPDVVYNGGVVPVTQAESYFFETVPHGAGYNTVDVSEFYQPSQSFARRETELITEYFR